VGKNMKKLLLQSVSWFLIVWFPIFVIVPVYAQDDDIMSETYFYDDSEEEESEETETPVEEPAEEKEVEAPIEKAEEKPVVIPPPVEEKVVTPEPEKEKIEESKPVEADVFQSEYDYAPETKDEEPAYTPETQIAKKDERKSVVQNAVIEGIQLSSEPGENENESIISCYFIFRDKPTSYFYESKARDKVIIFEFNDVELGSSPVPSATLTPIQKFKIRQEKVDANKEIVGLRPEWHDVVKVTFYMDAVPIIAVKDEYSVISFSFKWSTDSEANEAYVVDEGGIKPGWWWGIGSAVAVGGGLTIYFFLNKEEDINGPDGNGEIDISDIPVHTDNN
jgi:outer membrane biosynthesis protein TonB